MYKYLSLLIFAVLALGCSPAFAEVLTETIATPADTPAWVISTIGIVTGVLAFVAQVDAQIPESFKKKLPWWLVVVWNLLSGNYNKSKNADA